ncbi:MAG: chromate transporter [Clostridia bacterium]|nr:chromate transporter [Clostridia bacterium]
MIFLKLFFEFFKIGLFAVGGGMATMPFLYDLSESTGWFTTSQLADMIAISESTPGPIGVNMATYVGFTTVSEHYGSSFIGILGGVVATIGLVMPSVIIIVIIAGFLNKFKENRFVKGAFYGIRPASVGLICAAALLLIKNTILNIPETFSNIDWLSVINIKPLILAVVLFLGILKFKKIHPVAFLGIGAVAGIVFSM